MDLRLPTLLLALALPLAGCMGGTDAPSSQTVSASGGRVSPGWAYDGQGLVPGGATLEGSASNADNSGAFNVSFDYLGSKYVVTFDRFAQAEGKDFMDGGIAFALDEHGDSGVADASIPRIHALLAAWGSASVTRDGEPLTGKAGDRWNAHLMVSRDTVRGADGRILKADGATPYDPQTPGDATRVENDPQAIFWIKSPDGENAKREPLPVAERLTCSAPQCAASVEIPTEKGAESLTLNVTFTSAQDPVPVGVGEATVSLKDAGGNVTHTQQVRVTPDAPAVASFEVEAAGITGPMMLEVTGAGAFTAVVEGLIVFDDQPFLVVTWDEVTVS